MIPIIPLTSSPESVPDWLVVAGILALAAILMTKWVRHEIHTQKNRDRP